jgi:hypothetical protein
MRNPPVIGKINAIYITYTTSTKVYRELWGLKSTVCRLRFRREGGEKNNEYETKLLQHLIHFTLKATKNGDHFSNDGMKGRFRVISSRRKKINNRFTSLLTFSRAVSLTFELNDPDEIFFTIHFNK